MLLQFTPQLPCGVNKADTCYGKNMPDRRQFPSQGSSLFTAPVFNPVWFPFAQTAPLSPVPALWHCISKGSTPQRVCFSLYFLIFTATVTSSHHTICFLISFLLSSLWSLKCDSWSDLPLLVPSPASAEVRDCSWHTLLSSGAHLQTRVTARPHSTLNQLSLLMLWGFGDTQVFCYLATECLSRSSHLVEDPGCFTTQNMPPVLLQTIHF